MQNTSQMRRWKPFHNKNLVETNTKIRQDKLNLSKVNETWPIQLLFGTDISIRSVNHSSALVYSSHDTKVTIILGWKLSPVVFYL